MEIKCKTYFDKDIIRHIVYEKGIDFERVFADKVINLIEKNTREALIKLGWKPPKNKEKTCNKNKINV